MHLISHQKLPLQPEFESPTLCVSKRDNRWSSDIRTSWGMINDHFESKRFWKQHDFLYFQENKNRVYSSLLKPSRWKSFLLEFDQKNLKINTLAKAMIYLPLMILMNWMPFHCLVTSLFQAEQSCKWPLPFLTYVKTSYLYFFVQFYK